MLYELESSPFTQKSNQPEVSTNTNNNPSKPSANGIGFTSEKVYGPELPTEKIETNKCNGETLVVTANGNSSESLSTSDSEPEAAATTTTTIQKSSENQSSKKELTLRPVLTKLVPYETDDSSCSEESTHDNEYRVSTKAAVGEWKVTSTESHKKQDGTINELFKMSHSGYSAPVASWNGTKAQLTKEISNERREERKRSFSDSLDQGKVKHQKTNNNSPFKSNPGYNPVQEFHNAKNWGQNYKSFYSGNRHRRNFHRKSFHKSYRFRQ